MIRKPLQKIPILYSDEILNLFKKKIFINSF